MARSYFITRVSMTNDDPTALEFFPPKGSDELHEALKEAFPFELNLAARMRAAVIEFLLQEQQVEQFAPISPEYLPSPQSSFVSTLPSPAMTSSRTPQDASMSRRQSAAAGQPTQEALMDVWSLPNKPQAKVHTRRTMTTDEKKAYKQKRLIGACADCKRRRRKCEHNSAASGTSPVPQKVGKHKKRAPNPIPASKPDVADFSWDAPAFNLETDMAMPDMESLDTSFEFDTTEFDFSPDLNADWQLFPDLPIANNTYAGMSPTWSLDHNQTTYAPRADLSQQLVSPSGETVSGGFFSQDIMSQGVLSSGLAAGVDYNASWGNAPVSPVTPESLSPVSRTQSSDSPHDGGRRYAGNSSTDNFSVGSDKEQSRVSPGGQLQTTLTTIQSPNAFELPGNTNVPGSSPVPAPNIDHSSDPKQASTTTCRWAHLIKPTGDTSQAVSKSDQTANVQSTAQGIPSGVQDISRYDQESFRENLQDDDRDHREASFLIQELLQPRGKLQSQTPSTTSRPRSVPNQSSPLQSGGVHTQEHVAKQQEESSRFAKNATLQVQQGISSEDSLTREGGSRYDSSLARAPICVALYAAYCATSRSSSSVAIAAYLLIGLVLVLLSLSGISDSAKLSTRMGSQALRSISRLAGVTNSQSTTLPSRQSTTDLGSHQSNTSASLKRSLTSRLGLLRASVMV